MQNKKNLIFSTPNHPQGVDANLAKFLSQSLIKKWKNFEEKSMGKKECQYFYNKFDSWFFRLESKN